MQHDWTISLRINYSALANQWNASHIASIWTWNNRNALFLWIYNNTTQWQPYWSIQYAQYWEDYISSNKTVQNTWYNLIFTYNYSTRKYDMYVNWEKRMNWTFNNQYSLWSNTLYIGATCINLTQWRIIWKIAKYIIENKKRSDSEAVDYWNKVKKKYGY